MITGGSVGIGLAVAKGLAAEGCTCRPRRPRCRAAGCGACRGRCRCQGQGCSPSPATWRRPRAARLRLRPSEKEFGGADILLNNAGTGSNETIMEAPDSKWQYYWDLHVMAAIRLARGLVPVMRHRGGGVILNNASICASQPLWYEPIYNVTKAALVMLSKTMATEFIKDGIRVNAINPGFVLTPDWIKTAKQLTADTGGDWQGYIDQLAKENAPIGRFSSPEEVADFFVFLCSARASYSVGSTYFVDGGMLKTI